MNLSGIVRLTALYLAGVFSVLVIGSVMIAHEISNPFRQILVSLTGHHWVTVSILSIPIFLFLLIFFSFVVRSENAVRTLKADAPVFWAGILVIVTILMIGIDIIVYILHYLS